jgi:sn-glycerol 3-phosphate transport system ATP-binding protein
LQGGVSFELAVGAYAQHAQREVIMGIRPEDLQLTEGGNGNGGLAVRLVEQLGADTLVHGYFGENRTDMTIRLGGIQTFNSGEVLPVRVAADKIHLFAPDTEKRL